MTDSPKPPANRITVTHPVLNQSTRRFIFCGAGDDSKAPILKAIFEPLQKVGNANCDMNMGWIRRHVLGLGDDSIRKLIT
jgi:hypothetical protein